MKLAIFSKAVIRESNPKQVKLALKQVARDTMHTNLMQHTVGLNTATGEMVDTLNPYIVGESFNKVDKQQLFNNMANVGAHLVALARLLKVKLPTPTKKSRLHSTRTAGVLKFFNCTTSLLRTLETATNDDIPVLVKTKEGKSPDGKATTRELVSIDRKEWAARQEAAQERMREIIQEIAPIYWALSYDMLGVPPQQLFEAFYSNMEGAASEEKQAETVAA